MVAAALVCGNTVVLKPAEQSPGTAYCIVRAFRAAGLPDGVLNFLPGIGETVGSELVESPLVSTIAFTGSLAVGLQILRSSAVVLPGQGDLKRVVAELGGKNPIIVDSDADMDQVIPAVLYSAFGFAGQKCSAASRLIVHENRFDEVQERLAKAMETLVVGDPSDSSVTVGPVIDADAQRRIEEMIQRARRSTPTFSIPNYDGRGYFVAPTLVSEPELEAPIWRDEVFGPVLAMKKARSLEEAVVMANDSSYALTAGLFSRSPEAIAYGTSEIQAGNLYINRHITGAVPGRQPFGGYRLSGLGSKAGGREYLLHFLNTTVVTENTLRQGFVPEIS
jgi:RHH-type proline utilization regulon transcriptional repressor/proline dehydrogenase/delta 1-pyrroline-5-carboxylate dehydrogenase